MSRSSDSGLKAGSICLYIDKVFEDMHALA